MRTVTLSRLVLSIGGAIAMLAGCGGSQPPIGAPGAMPQSATSHFAYVANLGSDNVSAYAINASTGALAPVPGSPFAAGDAPFGLAIDPSGKFAYVANLDSDNVSGYAINASSGALTQVKGSPCLPRAPTRKA